MCLASRTSAFASVVDSIIDGLVAKLEMFSAYDVTRAAKQQGATENHYQMKGAVHARWFDLQNNGYTRSLVPTPTGDTWLYHPQGADIQPYTDRINNGQPGTTVLPSPNTAPTALPSPNTSPATPAPATPSLTATATATVATAAATGSSAKIQLRNTAGRLPIYADQLGEIGASAGSKIDIFVHTNKTIEIALAGSKTATPYAQYTIANDGRVYVAKSILETLYGPKPQTFRVSTDPTAKVVKIEYAPNGK